MLTDEYVTQKFREGIDCSMLVLAEAAGIIGITTEEAYRMGACFGAGMLTGGVCGAVTGAFIALGIKYGNHRLNDMDQKLTVTLKRDELVRRFKEEHGSVDCPEILGYDLRDPIQRQNARDNRAIDNKCPMFCRTAARLLNELLQEP
ncbi:MAG: C-GCAxxG-C-C family protein [Methanomassiliicoccaceae archaeon]|jgi:C_GCAxxG_C_C family probable redox protein|nr:C-GCAxxG-C-C family protein [Methanomassiliicoccaceae archaeon]